MGLFRKKASADATEPKNDVDKWILCTYAMWSQYADGDWHYIAGSTEKSKPEAASMRLMLRRDWEIHNRDELLDTVGYLTELFEQGVDVEDEDLEIGAWDLCRACQILAMAYVGGFIERNEMTAESIKVARIMQEYYSSWEELYESYLNGYRNWSDNEENIREREKICEELLNAVDGPKSLDWNFRLG